MSFRIRKIYDDLLPANKAIIEKIINLTRQSIADMDEAYYVKMRTLIKSPIYKKMKYIFFVAEDLRGNLKGFVQMSYATDLDFCYLDLLVTSNTCRSGGVGSSLYERVREEANYLNSIGIFYECMSDDKAAIHDPVVLKQNRARLRFYENFQSFPVINTGYEENSRKVYGTPYFLLFDRVERNKELLTSQQLANIVKAILERKYEGSCSRSDIKKLMLSISEKAIQFRQPLYIKKNGMTTSQNSIAEDTKISLLYNELHIIHHIKERGYVESPVRVKKILLELEKSGLFKKIKTRLFNDSFITAVHRKDFVTFFRDVTQKLDDDKILYPEVFPIRRDAKLPKTKAYQAGYYCFDIYSPITKNSYLAARAAVNCALTAADEVLQGNRIAYALVRPPGHHAERQSFGGFCYFNSTAIAADYLSKFGSVAILDIDYHHGNGQQDIFYERSDILTISIHGDPDFEYPHFSGFKDERGTGQGLGYNINYPLPREITGIEYHRYLVKATGKIKKFNPQFLVVAFGLDTAQGDPTGSWLLKMADFRINGEIIGDLALPTLVIQEGGYNNRVIGANARAFFDGLWNHVYKSGMT